MIELLVAFGKVIALIFGGFWFVWYGPLLDRVWPTLAFDRSPDAAKTRRRLLLPYCILVWTISGIALWWLHNVEKSF